MVSVALCTKVAHLVASLVAEAAGIMAEGEVLIMTAKVEVVEEDRAILAAASQARV